MFKAIRYAGKAYQNELAWECRRLGYQIEHIHNDKGLVEGFEIRGVSAELRQRFSKRRKEVEAGMEAFRAEYGREPTPSEVSFITRETRIGKLKEITTPEVVARQRSQLSSSELTQLEDIRKNAFNNTAPASFGSDRQALASARNHLFERHSVLRGYAVLAEALNQKLGYLTLEGLKRNVSSEYSGMVQLTTSSHNPILSEEFSTRKGLEAEHWSIKFDQGPERHYIQGASFDQRDQLKAAGAEWDPETRAWFHTDKNIAEQLQALSPSPAPTDKHYLQGAPFELKEQLKELGCQWDPACKQWYHADREAAAKAQDLVNQQIQRRMSAPELKAPAASAVLAASTQADHGL